MTCANLQNAWKNKQYSQSEDAVKRMRDTIAGEDVIKSEGETYLQHPCNDEKEKNSPEGQARYLRYKSSAEFDNITSNTLETLTGAMYRIPPTIELPSGIKYMLEDADGNGNGLNQSMELTSTECLQMRYHCALVEYSSLAGLDIDKREITNDQARAMGLKATIKHYNRESLINWSYAVINGVKQLNMVLLYQAESQVLTPGQITNTGIENKSSASLLMLGLDEDGDYFQRKLILTDDGEDKEWGEAFYPRANGNLLKYIPFEIIYATERNLGDVPRQLGYLDPISLKCVHRYQVSALLKEALRITAQPTSFSKGWTDAGFKLYQKMTGEEQINLGSTNHIALPKEMDAGYLDWNADSNGLFKYMSDSKGEIVALGGNFDEVGENAETATAAAINSAEKKAVLSTLAKNEEESYRRLIDWAGEFMGVDTSSVVIKMSREFVAITLTPEQRASITAGWMNGLISRSEAMRQLKRGGALTEEINTIMNELSTDGVM